MITPQKFIAELRMLRTRAKELGLPATANMIGRAIEVCDGERDGDFLTVRRRNEKEQKKCATGKDGENTSAVTREAEEDWAKERRR